MTKSVVLIDDHHLIRQGLRRAFERSGDCQVLAEAATLAEGMTLVDRLRPDVVIFDLRLPDGSGLEAVRKARATHPRLGIVVLTVYAGDEQRFAALEAGASAFVPKYAPADDVVAAARHATASANACTAGDLTEAIRRRLLSTGPQPTTKAHFSKIRDKLGATNRARARKAARRTGLISTDQH